MNIPFLPYLCLLFHVVITHVMTKLLFAKQRCFILSFMVHKGFAMHVCLSVCSLLSPDLLSSLLDGKSALGIYSFLRKNV